ncbi:MAG: DUF4244 domain-containing protein [Micrococcaceae bacterium]
MITSPTTGVTHETTLGTGLDLLAEDGAQTAEYGIVTLAAVGFAGVLTLVLSSGAVQSLLTGLVEKALSF